MIQIACLLLFSQTAKTPLEFGCEAVARATGSRSSDVQVEIRKGGPKESFTIEGDGRKVRIVGADQNGAMYGAYEFVERLEQHPDQAWSTQFKDEPFLPDRGLNLFLTLPWNYQKNDTDFDVAALTDPNRWWFANEDYWTTLLDLMAKSRLNWLDIHGGWDISVTNAPNLYAYFVTSPSFPKVGVPEDVKAKDLAQLNHVIEMAHERGIRVSLMCYEANLKIPQNPNPPYAGTEQNIYKYTREVVEQMIRKAPKLDAIGFRIGESGHGESFFTCYGEAVKASGRDIPLITRSWVTRKQKVLPLARASKDFTVEIKYNGEQWGAPYMVAGGRMADWGSYSYEDYLSDSSPNSESRSQKPKKTWPGWPAEGGGNWPSEPYKIVWQVRANGTHRIFPFYNPEWVRRSIEAMKVGTASGYTIEGEDAYYPKQPIYYLANPADRYCHWVHQRDEMYWMTWGRLGYDPKTADEVFDTHAEKLLGAGTADLVKAWKTASTLVSKGYMAYALGPDHRDHATELEWGGDTEAFIQGAGFDTSAYSPIADSYANAQTLANDGRITAYEAAHDLEADAKSAADLAAAYSSTSDPRRREIAQSVLMRADLADYYANRLLSANAMASIESLGEGERKFGETDDMAAAASAHEQLAGNAYYKPFTERLRMHTNTFSWKEEDAKVQAEAKRVASLPAPDKDGSVLYATSSHTGDPGGTITWSDHNGRIVCRAASDRATSAYLLIKPLPSSTFFHRVGMYRVGDHFEASFDREPFGFAIGAEFHAGTEAWRAPSPYQSMPYEIIPAQPGPTPQLYAFDEAMTYLDPKLISPDRYGAILIGSRAQRFFHNFDLRTERKLLDPVERGMKLVILQEDFSKDKLDFLPKPLKLEAFQSNTFDPGGQLGLDEIKADGIMWQRFLPSDGWDIFGNGGLARLKLGKGEVWVTSARLMQNMVIPSAAEDFVAMLGVGGKEKPTVVVDACTEGGPYTSSCHQDLMNSHGIPFLTLGEVIAREQGMNSFTAIPGPVMDDDVLDGKGTAMANKFLRDRVISMSKVPTPPSLESFEKIRKQRKAELLKSLGLDPMPPKTPLNARVTGTIPGNGYHIEKVVYESRPHFYVTAHVYVPDRPGASKCPVIMNVNGHWAHKKDEDRIQLRCQFEALQGYIAIAIDSPGWSFEGNNLIERRLEGDHNDWFLVEGGSNTTGYYVWDAIRGLDYMATRPDTDMSRVGITGASGGGLTTLYTFAADDRYKAAVPVVYMASLELAPDNGCLCNHVPGTCQIGDRSDVCAIQAPKPVFIMGAQNDGEFPPDATRLTATKMRGAWKLFGKDGDVFDHIYAGPHDYNQLMREQMIGFFDKYLKNEGDGSPVQQPDLKAIDPENHELLVLDPPESGETTMRELSQSYLKAEPANVPVAEAIAINGGRPKDTPLNYREEGTGSKRTVTFESEPGLVTPAILVLPGGKVKGVRIYAADDGKAAEIGRSPSEEGYACLYIDALGTGELSGIEMRYPIYAGRAVAFTAGWQLVQAARAMRKYSSHIEVVGRGAMSSQAAMWAGLLGQFEKVTGLDGLGSWMDVFEDGVNPIAVQPRAHLCGSLENLRRQVRNGTWTSAQEETPTQSSAASK